MMYIVAIILAVPVFVMVLLFFLIRSQKQRQAKYAEENPNRSKASARPNHPNVNQYDNSQDFFLHNPLPNDNLGDHNFGSGDSHNSDNNLDSGSAGGDSFDSGSAGSDFGGDGGSGDY